MNLPVFPRLREVLAPYDAVLLDVWGVLHDGRRPYPGARQAFADLIASGRPVVLLTNASYTGERVRQDLDHMGFDLAGLRGVVTAGETTRALIADHRDRLGPRFWFICRAEHAPLLRGLEVQPLDGPEGADFVVVSHGHADPDALARAAAMGLPMVCTNPDLEVVHQDGSVSRTAGAVARDYEALGGTVQAAGKPHRPIFEVGLQMLGPHERPVLIGDSPNTDLLGAKGVGLDVLWLQRLPVSEARKAAALALQPTAWVTDLRW